MIGKMNPELFEHYKKCDDGIHEDGALSTKMKILKKGLPRFVCRECGNILMPGACE